MTALAERLDREPALRALRAALIGHHEPIWLVGGAVRDVLAGRSVHDVDLVVGGDPEPHARTIATSAGAAAFSLSQRFGAWRAIDRRGAWVCDLSPLHGETIEHDLARRDFSVNAMAVPVDGGELVDPHGGARDLDARILRVLGAGAYADDPLRPLRLARLATELAFDPSPETETLTREAAPLVGRASGERVFGELRRLLIADRAVEGLELADRLGLIAAILPEVDALHDVEQSHFHHLDVYRHTLEVVRRVLGLERRLEETFGDLAEAVGAVLAAPLADQLTRGQALRLAALLHDIGKPATRARGSDGRVTFLGHDKRGERMVGAVCGRLRTSARLRDFVAALTRSHLVLGFMVDERPLSRRDVYRYLVACEPVEVEVAILSCADRLATRGKNASAAIAAHLDLARQLIGEALGWRAAGRLEPLVRGDVLADVLGIDPGPQLGALLAQLREARFAGEVSTSAEAIELGRRLHQNAPR